MTACSRLALHRLPALGQAAEDVGARLAKAPQRLEDDGLDPRAITGSLLLFACLGGVARLPNCEP
eukprot:3388392-Lingulodinium_polyedra.AAC.1